MIERSEVKIPGWWVQQEGLGQEKTVCITSMVLRVFFMKCMSLLNSLFSSPDAGAGGGAAAFLGAAAGAAAELPFLALG